MRKANRACMLHGTEDAALKAQDSSSGNAIASARMKQQLLPCCFWCGGERESQDTRDMQNARSRQAGAAAGPVSLRVIATCIVQDRHEGGDGRPSCGIANRRSRYQDFAYTPGAGIDPAYRPQHLPIGRHFLQSVQDL